MNARRIVLSTLASAFFLTSSVYAGGVGAQEAATQNESMAKAKDWRDAQEIVGGELSEALEQLISDEGEDPGIKFQKDFAVLEQEVAEYCEMKADGGELAKRMSMNGGLFGYVERQIKLEDFAPEKQISLGRKLLALEPMQEDGGVDQETFFQLLDLGARLVVWDPASKYIEEAASNVFKQVIANGYSIDNLLRTLIMFENVGASKDWTAENNKFFFCLCDCFLKQSQVATVPVLTSICCVRSGQERDCTADELREVMQELDNFPHCPTE